MCVCSLHMLCCCCSWKGARDRNKNPKAKYCLVEANRVELNSLNTLFSEADLPVCPCLYECHNRSPLTPNTIAKSHIVIHWCVHSFLHIIPLFIQTGKCLSLWLSLFDDLSSLTQTERQGKIVQKEQKSWKRWLWEKLHTFSLSLTALFYSLSNTFRENRTTFLLPVSSSFFRSQPVSSCTWAMKIKPIQALKKYKSLKEKRGVREWKFARDASFREEPNHVS